MRLPAEARKEFTTQGSLQGSTSDPPASRCREKGALVRSMLDMVENAPIAMRFNAEGAFLQYALDQQTSARRIPKVRRLYGNTDSITS